MRRCAEHLSCSWLPKDPSCIGLRLHTHLMYNL